MKWGARQIDALNILMMLIALVLAISLPFKLFLFSYAVLGPLHYLTEIGWLHKKNYFSSSKHWLSIALLCTFLICLGPLLHYMLTEWSFFEKINTSNLPFKPLYNLSISLLFLAFFLALLYGSSLNKSLKIALGILIGISSFYIQHIPLGILLFGVFLPTLIHVYVFTAIFILYGSLKNKSTLGLISSLILLIIGVGIFFLPIQSSQYLIESKTQSNFMASSFQNVHYGIRQLMSYLIDTPFEKAPPFFTALGIKIQIFIAFAYTYHYLNWFSKTSIIGWHKLKKSNLIILLLIWGASVLLYAINYKLGFMCLLFLSFLHVLLEFPLNILSIKTIYTLLKKTEP